MAIVVGVGVTYVVAARYPLVCGGLVSGSLMCGVAWWIIMGYVDPDAVWIQADMGMSADEIRALLQWLGLGLYALSVVMLAVAGWIVFRQMGAIIATIVALTMGYYYFFMYIPLVEARWMYRIVGG